MNHQKLYAKFFEYVGVYNFSEKFWRDSKMNFFLKNEKYNKLSKKQTKFI